MLLTCCKFTVRLHLYAVMKCGVPNTVLPEKYPTFMHVRGKLSLSCLGRAKSPLQTQIARCITKPCALSGKKRLPMVAPAEPYLQQTKGCFLVAKVTLPPLAENSSALS